MREDNGRFLMGNKAILLRRERPSNTSRVQLVQHLRNLSGDANLPGPTARSMVTPYDRTQWLRKEGLFSLHEIY